MFLETKHLLTLETLMSSGSLARAAEQLHLTQSALSHQIKGLESHFGVVLFERKTRPPRLTPAGAALFELAKTVLPAVRRTESALRHIASGADARLHITVECHSCFDWLLPAMDVYRRDWPDVELDLNASQSFEALPALLEGELDLVITSDPIADPRLRFQPLFGFDILLALSPSHRLAGRKYIKPSDLAGETLITYPVERERLDVFSRFLTPAGVEPAAVRTAELALMMLELVKSNRGVSVLPGWVLAAPLAAGQVVSRRLGKRGLAATLYAASRKADQGQTYLEDFIATAQRSAFAELAEIEPV